MPPLDSMEDARRAKTRDLRDVAATKQRAFSILTIKAVADDPDFWTINGIASTPTVDRMGDIVEPKGATFSLPIPLLWQHDSEKPVGQVVDAKVSSKGISFTAKIPKVKEAGAVKERIDEAVLSLQHKLVAATSIGFRPLSYGDDALELLPDGGIRFLAWEWLELSLVTIPAQPDAVITGVKSIDAEIRNLLKTSVSPPGAKPSDERQRARVVRINPTAGASATPSTKGKAVKTYTEQIADAANQRAANVARMDALMKAAGERGETLNEQESQEFNDLDSDNDRIDVHLKSLRRMEQLVKEGATPVDTKANGGGTPAEAGNGGSRAPAKPIVLREKELPQGIRFARFLMCMHQAKGNPQLAASIAKSRGYGESSPDVSSVLNAMAQGFDVKTAVAGGNTTDTTWASPLAQYTNLASEFINYLRPQTIFGRLQGIRRVPFLVKIPRQTAGASGYWVGEQAGKPLSKLAFDSITMGPTKMATIVVISDELARNSSPSAEAVVRDDVAAALAQFQDQQAFSPGVAGVANTNPASLTYGASSALSGSSSGSSGTVANVYADVTTAIKVLAAANIDTRTAVWIMDPATALAIGTLQTTIGTPAFPDVGINGGTLLGIPVIVSNNVTHSTSGGGVMILINPSDIILADDGGVTIDVSNEASLQMVDNPTNSAASLVSMFQTNQIAIRAELYVNYALRRSASVTYVDQAHYAG